MVGISMDDYRRLTVIFVHFVGFVVADCSAVSFYSYIITCLFCQVVSVNVLGHGMAQQCYYVLWSDSFVITTNI